MRYKNGEIGLENLGERVLISIPSRRRGYPKGGFAMFLQQSFLKLAADSKYSINARMLFFYMAVVEYDNRIKSYTQQEISEMTNIARPNVSKAHKILESDGIIYKDGRDYYFSEEYILKGVKNFKIVCVEDGEEVAE